MPLEEPTVAVAVLALLQVPPGVVQVRVDEPPGHTAGAPVIAAGDAFTVTVAVTEPVPVAYVIIEVPVAAPDTTPPDVTVATLVVPLVQVPPAGVLLSVVEPPTHNVSVPVMGVGPEVEVSVTVVEAAAE